MTGDELREFIEQFHDYLAPRLDTYEQAIYLYIFRHGRLKGEREVVIGFKSARARMATGLGVDGTPMSEGSAYKKLASLEVKGCIKVIQTEHKGRRIELYLPKEISGLVTAPVSADPIDIEELDFFIDPNLRIAILKREQNRCFYTLKAIDKESFVLDHVVSRPKGSNTYRNLVAASREANNRKGAMAADEFIRSLYRDGYLSEAEFEERMNALDDLFAGRLKPEL